MGLTKINPSLIDGGLAATGLVLGKRTKESVGFIDPSEASKIPGTQNAQFDTLTGTLTIVFPDGSQSTVTGLPTADQLKSGREGKQGKEGLRGLPGADGRDGRDGSDGCPGPRGPRGRQGPTGNTGPNGATGNTGAVGPTGPTGPTGSPGRDAAIDEYLVSQALDPVTGAVIPNAWIGSNQDMNTGFKDNMGRIVNKSTTDTIHVIFNTPFINRCLGIQITFVNAATNQARTYQLYNLDGTSAMNENALLGGFTIKSTGTNTVGWDFWYHAVGD
ncbi:MAG: collagen-like protein [Raoultibacter sp.]